LGRWVRGNGTMRARARVKSFATVLPVFAIGVYVCCAGPLASWNETAPKKAIIDFVERVTKEGSPDFVKPEERIALFAVAFDEVLPLVNPSGAGWD
jgi:hypothetical protein